MPHGTVLVVDDDPAFRALMRATLESAEFVVLEADNGGDALRIALEQRPEVVLLDWRMPGESGITVCRRLREEQDLAGVRIAMVTGLDDERDRTLARKAGADAFVVKDADPAALAFQVRRLIRRESTTRPA